MLRDEPLRFRLLKRPKAQDYLRGLDSISYAHSSIELDFGAWGDRQRYN